MDDFVFPSIITTQPSSSSSHLIKNEISFAGASLPPPPSLPEVKARIMAHPHYPNLVAAYADCHKLGAPPEVAARLSSVSGDLQLRSGGGRNFPTADPELDQFMEAYYDILVKYKEELSKPFEEAADFLRKAESQLSSITDLSSMSFHFSTEKKQEELGFQSLEDGPKQTRRTVLVSGYNISVKKKVSRLSRKSLSGKSSSVSNK